MVAWLTTITSVLPLLTDLVSKALPVLTSKRNDKTADIVAQQIGELQNAVTENAQAIKILAEQLQRTVVAVEDGAEDLQQSVTQFKASLHTTSLLLAALERRMSQLDKHGNRMLKLCLITMGLALAAMFLSLLSLAR